VAVPLLLFEEPELDLTVELSLLLLVEPELERVVVASLLLEGLCDCELTAGLLLVDSELDLTVELSLLLLLLVEPELERVVVASLLLEGLCDCELTAGLLLVDSELDLTVELLVLLVELCGVTVLLLVLDELLLVALSDDLTVALRSVEGVPVREPVPSEDLVASLLLLTVPDLVASLLLLVELLPLTEDLVVELLSLFASGRYTLTVLSLILVALPERLLLLSSRRTVAVLPVSRSYSLALGPL
jgi:hypothetical protein